MRSCSPSPPLPVCFPGSPVNMLDVYSSMWVILVLQIALHSQETAVRVSLSVCVRMFVYFCDHCSCHLLVSAASSLCSGCDCTNCCLLEPPHPHPPTRGSSSSVTSPVCTNFWPVALGPVEETPPPKEMDQHMHWTLSLCQGRPVMLIDSRSTVLASLALSSAEVIGFVLRLGLELEPRHRLFSQKP